MNSDIDKKNLILEKAKDMIITESYSSLSISKLTSELNISKGSFYTYFPSKDKMLSEILDEYIKNITIFKNNLLENSKNIDECLDYYINSLLNLTDDELKLELVITNLKRNYEVFNEENFKKLKDIACIMIDLVKEVLTKYKKDINIEEKDIEKCSKMIFSIAEVFLIMRNVDFDSDRFTFKTLDEVKKMYRSDDIKDHFEFIKKSIKKIIY
ncbi:TetR/AcrR family transcriptional regulator [Fusobacterium polymorphum]|uniref:TetR family transcriptional regulator n=1 Tax=Fusobacterium nucleatum subsp. polymorphum TaxID=76857 RepID=A0A2C6C070_FUSNP|nr:TetR/AcrR family transcriptional regulator [Fusobacterium polymorphum]PHI09841.1 TetR family transcriptional regulator [Fusobacterium polymorphum]PIM76638.1 TetR/AcrR family transcriptional regulator [Fusobacterium polymorphum]